MVVLARTERDVYEFLKISSMILSYMVDVKMNMILGGVVGKTRLFPFMQTKFKNYNRSHPPSSVRNEINSFYSAIVVHTK